VKPTKSKALLTDLRQLIAEARQDVARQVNSALVLLYWRVGKRIRQDILKEKRAEYGGQIVSALKKFKGSGVFSRGDCSRRDFAHCAVGSAGEGDENSGEGEIHPRQTQCTPRTLSPNIRRPLPLGRKGDASRIEA